MFSLTLSHSDKDRRKWFNRLQTSLKMGYMDLGAVQCEAYL